MVVQVPVVGRGQERDRIDHMIENSLPADIFGRPDANGYLSVGRRRICEFARGLRARGEPARPYEASFAELLCDIAGLADLRAVAVLTHSGDTNQRPTLEFRVLKPFRPTRRGQESSSVLATVAHQRFRRAVGTINYPTVSLLTFMNSPVQQNLGPESIPSGGWAPELGEGFRLRLFLHFSDTQ